jgi:hypothetical protein
MDEKLKKILDEARDRCQTERVAIRTDKFISEEERQRRTVDIQNREHMFWQSLGDVDQGRVRARIEELQPLVVPAQTVQLGSEPPVAIEGSVLDEFYFLRRIAGEL